MIGLVAHNRLAASVFAKPVNGRLAVVDHSLHRPLDARSIILTSHPSERSGDDACYSEGRGYAHLFSFPVTTPLVDNRLSRDGLERFRTWPPISRFSRLGRGDHRSQRSKKFRGRIEPIRAIVRSSHKAIITDAIRVCRSAQITCFGHKGFIPCAA